jgi:hypothetical protein
VVLGRDKDRTKNNADRLVQLCPRASAVLKRQLALREACQIDGKIQHDFIFFKDDGGRIIDLSYPTVAGATS